MNSNSKAVNNESKATFAEMMDRKAWTMTVERKETRTGNVSFIHTVYFQGEVFDTRKSKREYRAYWLNIEAGRITASLTRGIAYDKKMAAKYRKAAEEGGLSTGICSWGPEELLEWVGNHEKHIERKTEELKAAEAAGPEFDYRVTDGGFCGRPDLCKGNLSVNAE